MNTLKELLADSKEKAKLVKTVTMTSEHYLSYIACIERLEEAHEKIIHRFSNNCDCDMASTDALSEAAAILAGNGEV